MIKKRYLLVSFIALIFFLVHTNIIVAKEANINTMDKAIVITVIETDEGLNFNYINSDNYYNNYTESYVVNNITMVQLEDISKVFGYSVQYNLITKKIILEDTDNQIILTIGSKNVIINGVNDEMDGLPMVINNNVWIPLRYVSEFFNKHISWCKSIKPNEILVWVSDLPLLTDDDVAAENNVNYIRDFEIPTPYYYLTKTGETSRGLKLGDDYEKVINLYNKPHKKIVPSEDRVDIYYYTEFLPGTSSGNRLLITVENTIVTSVGID